MIDTRDSVLLVVDIQPDFLPGGALGVAGGDAVLEPIADLMRRGRFDLCVATQDWHPPGHISFASTHPGRRPLDVIELYGHTQTLWPDHCVQGTSGAELRAGMPWERVTALIRKATDPMVDSYSAFRNNWNADGERPRTGLAGYLRERRIENVYICGLARDYCAHYSAIDAVDAGFRTWVLWDLTRPVDPASDDEVRTAMIEHNVTVIDVAQLYV
jgi:nicotinamidase/pyrazinamidase